MAQYIKFVQEPAGFETYIRLEKGAKPFPESQRDSYWYCDFDFEPSGYCCDRHTTSKAEERLKCASKFADAVENESDANANGVFRLKVGQTLVEFWNERATRHTPRQILVHAAEPTCTHEAGHYFVEISAVSAAEECPEILDWNAAPAPSGPTAPTTSMAAETTETANISARRETTDMFARDEIALAREEIALLRKEIAVLHSEMDARQKRTDAIMAAAIHNLDEKISAK